VYWPPFAENRHTYAANSLVSFSEKCHAEELQMPGNASAWGGPLALERNQKTVKPPGIRITPSVPRSTVAEYAKVDNP